MHTKYSIQTCRAWTILGLINLSSESEVEIVGLICKSHISKDLRGSFSIPSRKVTRLVFRGPGLVELMTSSRRYFHDFPETSSSRLLHTARSIPLPLLYHPSPTNPWTQALLYRALQCPYVFRPKHWNLYVLVILGKETRPFQAHCITKGFECCSFVGREKVPWFPRSLKSQW